MSARFDDHRRPSRVVGGPRELEVHRLLNTRRVSQPNIDFPGGVARSITLHETGNTSPGATARAHARWQERDGGPRYSWHATVDEKDIWLSLPFERQAWHAGDGRKGRGNTTSYAIEICVNANLVVAWENAIAFAQAIFQAGLAEPDLYQHYHWSGKDCPALLRAGKVPGLDWPEVLRRILEPPPESAPLPPEESEVIIGAGAEQLEGLRKQVEELSTRLRAAGEALVG